MSGYDTFYRFKEKPFALQADPRYLFKSENHQMALELLENSLVGPPGFCLITGVAGVGKTTLLRHLLTKIPGHITVGHFSLTRGSLKALRERVLSAFQLVPGGPSKNDAHNIFVNFVNRQHATNKGTVLIIDNAHTLSVEALAELASLTGFDADIGRGLHVILVGEPELLDSMRSPSLARLAKRVTLNHELKPLSLRQTCEYIRTRLQAAGSQTELFTKAAGATVFWNTDGIPRMINLLCDSVLVYGFTGSHLSITKELVNRVVHDRKTGRLLPTLNKVKQEVETTIIQPQPVDPPNLHAAMTPAAMTPETRLRDVRMPPAAVKPPLEPTRMHQPAARSRTSAPRTVASAIPPMERSYDLDRTNIVELSMERSYEGEGFAIPQTPFLQRVKNAVVPAVASAFLLGAVMAGYTLFVANTEDPALFGDELLAKNTVDDQGQTDVAPSENDLNSQNEMDSKVTESMETLMDGSSIATSETTADGVTETTVANLDRDLTRSPTGLEKSTEAKTRSVETSLSATSSERKSNTGYTTERLTKPTQTQSQTQPVERGIANVDESQAEVGKSKPQPKVARVASPSDAEVSAASASARVATAKAVNQPLQPTFHELDQQPEPDAFGLLQKARENRLRAEREAKQKHKTYSSALDRAAEATTEAGDDTLFNQNKAKSRSDSQVAKTESNLSNKPVSSPKPYVSTYKASTGVESSTQANVGQANVVGTGQPKSAGSQSVEESEAAALETNDNGNGATKYTFRTYQQPNSAPVSNQQANTRPNTYGSAPATSTTSTAPASKAIAAPAPRVGTSTTQTAPVKQSPQEVVAKNGDEKPEAEVFVANPCKGPSARFLSTCR